MDIVELDATVKAEGAMDTGHNSHQEKPKADIEHPLALNNEQVVNEDADEYPSVIRRTVIVIGVALALFCVCHQH